MQSYKPNFETEFWNTMTMEKISQQQKEWIFSKYLGSPN